ncbi:hypothetical protein [Janibacter hoylei]|uniref:hypothetical protein n=1 Tax=Janibacter hoylei TaxID=364298 RepID=UPI00288306D4|nr:hypothetical protein [Janibacter hoylei]
MLPPAGPPKGAHVPPRSPCGRLMCLQEAIDRAEPWGVWGGEILQSGQVIARKRVRGRPRRDVAA